MALMKHRVMGCGRDVDNLYRHGVGVVLLSTLMHPVSEHQAFVWQLARVVSFAWKQLVAIVAIM